MLINDCPRCSQRHEDLPTEELLNSLNYWDSWAMCPVVEQPILLVSDERKNELYAFVFKFIDMVYEEADTSYVLETIKERLKK